MIVLDAFGSRKKTLALNSATPDVTNVDVGVGNYNQVVTITNFLQGDNGNHDQFFLFVNNYDGVVIQHDTSKIKLMGGIDITLNDGDVMLFWKNSATEVWNQIGGATIYL